MRHGTNHFAPDCFDMKSAFRRIVVRLGYFLISKGLSLPESVSEMVESSQQAVYLRDLLKRLKINCVLDVGAHTGESVRLLRRIGFRGVILSFEPHPDCFKSLCSAFCNDPYWKGFNIALGSKNELKSLNMAKLSFHSSFLSSRIIKTTRVANVRMKRLDSIIDSLLEDIVRPRVFLKIDTQGYDLKVVEGASGCMERILGLQSEISVTPVYEDMPHYLKSLASYESLGFDLMNLFTVTRTTRYGSVLEYDCLMARLEQLDLELS
jgi:FkbM family methyltransferase